jgi:hypothetical protein
MARSKNQTDEWGWAAIVDKELRRKGYDSKAVRRIAAILMWIGRNN